MKIEIRELHVHAPFQVSDIAYFKTLLENIMSNQVELVAQIVAVTGTVTKIKAETQSLLAKIEELTAAVVAAGNTSPEVDAAMAALTDQLGIVDALVADAEPAPATDPVVVDTPTEPAATDPIGEPVATDPDPIAA